MAIAETVVTFALKAVLDTIERRLRNSKLKTKLDLEDVKGAIQRHLVEANNWSSQVSTLYMTNPDSIDSSTIALSFHTEPRKFRGGDTPNNRRAELSLLADSENYLLLGDPGSGKTTTLKRLTRHCLSGEPLSDLDQYQFPIVIRLRELDNGKTIYMALADIFRIRYEQVEIKTVVKGKHEHASDVVLSRIETRIGDHRIEEVIGDLLCACKAVLIVDGLDEVRSSDREKVYSDLVSLSRTLDGSKVIASARSGEVGAALEGFFTLEICPLDASQVRAIAERWLGDPSDFLVRLDAVPYLDLADRPLLLTQLLFHYKRYGFLPEQPASIYKRVIRILLEEWDAERQISRTSKYSGFDAERKGDFLAALAYQLTIILQKKRFSEDDLVSIYCQICAPFDLPKDEARQVARELQTHTGIIVASSDNSYEFSHLSLQEYLCASYLVRGALADSLSERLAANPASLAVSVVLSSTPGAWFARIVLGHQNLRLVGPHHMAGLLQRLIVERPFFEQTELMGFALFKLYETTLSGGFLGLRDRLDIIVEMNNVKASLANALRFYEPDSFEGQRTDLAKLRLKSQVTNPYSVPLPPVGALPKATLKPLLKKGRQK